MAPAFDTQLQMYAETLVRRLLDHLDYTGVMALELFIKDGKLLANEFAPRVHNSGHWTIDGDCTSQFENHLLAICGLPLGNTHSESLSLMFNLLGEMPACVSQHIFDETTQSAIHWNDYHKTPRAGRKIGHVTVTDDNLAGLRARAAQLASALGVAAELNLETVMADLPESGDG
jgi:5-(carboxyamino)imidazole ribonucleotide synthase